MIIPDTGTRVQLVNLPQTPSHMMALSASTAVHPQTCEPAIAITVNTEEDWHPEPALFVKKIDNRFWAHNCRVCDRYGGSCPGITQLEPPSDKESELGCPAGFDYGISDIGFNYDIPQSEFTFYSLIATIGKPAPDKELTHSAVHRPAFIDAGSLILGPTFRAANTYGNGAVCVSNRNARQSLAHAIESYCGSNANDDLCEVSYYKEILDRITDEDYSFSAMTGRTLIWHNQMSAPRPYAVAVIDRLHDYSAYFDMLATGHSPISEQLFALPLRRATVEGHPVLLTDAQVPWAFLPDGTSLGQLPSSVTLTPTPLTV